MLPAMRRALVVLLLSVATPPLALAGTTPPRIDHHLSLSLEGGVDTNARRTQVGSGERLDVLGYGFASGRLDVRWPQMLARVDLEVGGKLYAQVAAEDLLAGRLQATLTRAIARRMLLRTELTYKDKVQAGDPIDAVEDDPLLACAPPPGVPRTGYRCNRRDYRTGGADLGLDFGLGARTTLRTKAGFTGFQYKPNDEFTYMGPGLSLNVQHVLSRALAGSLFASAAWRFYHPASVTYRLVAGGNLLAQETDRVEQVYGVGLSARYRGPVLLALSATLFRTLNNSVGMDAWRGRVELSGAAKLTRSTTLVFNTAFQIAYYPEGNVLSLFYAVGDQDERQNSLALKLSQRVSDRLALVLKVQAYANELSAAAQPFRRGVAHIGLKLDL